jgi:hypothetical protein
MSLTPSEPGTPGELIEKVNVSKDAAKGLMKFISSVTENEKPVSDAEIEITGLVDAAN